MMIKVEGHSNLYKKDSAVVNTDYSAFVRAKERKQEKQKIQSFDERLTRIEELLERLVTNVNKT